MKEAVYCGLYTDVQKRCEGTREDTKAIGHCATCIAECPPKEAVLLLLLGQKLTLENALANYTLVPKKKKETVIVKKGKTALGGISRGQVFKYRK